MRSALTLGVAALLAIVLGGLLGGCGEDNVAARAQEDAALEALRTALPAVQTVVDVQSSSFAGAHRPCNWANNAFKYYIEGWVAGPRVDEPDNSPALRKALEDANWELRPTPKGGDPKDTSTLSATQGRMELFLDYSRTVKGQDYWNLELTTDCAGYSDADTKRMHGPDSSGIAVKP